MGKLLEVKNLTKKYYEGSTESRAVDRINLEVDEEEFVMIMGASGSGKTSLMHLIAGIDDFDEGTIEFTQRALPGASIRESSGASARVSSHISASASRRASSFRGRRTSSGVSGNVDFSHMGEKAKAMFRRTNIGIVFQQHCLIPDLTVYENIMLPVMLAGSRKEKDSMRDTIFSLCEQFGLKEHIRKYPSQLSGGQQQRAAILRAVVNRPPLLLCDEPTGSLNSAQSGMVMDLLNELNQKGQTILLVTHDVKTAVRGKRVIYIEDGRVEGELKFAETDPKEAEKHPAASAHDGAAELPTFRHKEEALMAFLQKRGW